MRFKVKNIRPGYCEIWANEYVGQRYWRIATVSRLDNNGWHWLAMDYHILPEDNYVAQSTRRDCINDCKRTALLRLVEHAIEGQPKESKHWHSPRRDAWCMVTASNLFAQDELGEIKERLETFKVSWHDYDIRVWGDGDVSINSYDLLGFGQLNGVSGIQCNTCDESKKEYIRKACMDVANAVRALDALVGGDEDGC